MLLGPSPPSRKTTSVFLSTLILLSFCLFAIWHDREYRLAAGIDTKEGKNRSYRTDDPNNFSWDKCTPSKDLVWNDCYATHQCARLIVPLNYSDPNGEIAIIALTRKASLISQNSPLYRGPVLFNPGGPGGSGVDLVLQFGDALGAILGPQFDVVGFDPRGVGRSVPRVSYFKTEVERQLWGDFGLHVVNNSDEGISRTWARSVVKNKLAAESDDGYLVHINTDNTARDMLRIVEAHGREKLQYWGFSYGSVLGATFAALFPDKVERLVIDGVVDAENYFDTLWSNNLLDTDKAMQFFFKTCADAGPLGCPFYAPTPEAVQRNLTKLYDSVRAKPVPVRTETSYGLLDYNLLRLAVFASLYSPYVTFLPLATGLSQLAAGDATLLFQALQPPPFQCPSQLPENAFNVIPDAQSAILCNDGKDIPGDLDSSEQYFKMITESSQWGELWASIRFSCIGWPKFPKNHFQGPFVGNTSHPILLVGNTADPVTPLWAAKKMSQGFPGSVVLTQDSSGHASINAPSVCTQFLIRRYFVTGALPKPGTICSVFKSPFPNSLRVLENQMPFGDFAVEDEHLFIEAIETLSNNLRLPLPL